MSYLFNKEVDFVSTAVDAFSRLKVSNPLTIFDSQHRYQENDKWNHTSVNGTITHLPNESVMSLAIPTTSGSKIVRETKRVFPYQPGKALMSMHTFVFAAKQANLRQRVGHFGTNNGIYLEQAGNINYLVLRTSVSGSVDDTTYKVAQSAWNGDKFDGTGPSGRTIDFTKANIMWIDIEWLGVGDVRVGFIVDGRPVVAHTFHNDNLNTTTYMTTAVLPLRAEIEATGNLGSAATMKQICNTVISDGGYQGFARQFHLNKSTGDTLTTKGTAYPIVAIRMASTRLDSVILPAKLDVAVDQTINNKLDAVKYELLLNPTLTGTWGSWTAHANNNVEYVWTSGPGTSTFSGGTSIASGYVSSSSGINLSEINNFTFQLGRTLGNVSDVLMVVLTPVIKDGAVTFTNLSWHEVI